MGGRERDGGRERTVPRDGAGEGSVSEDSGVPNAKWGVISRHWMAGAYSEWGPWLLLWVITPTQSGVDKSVRHHAGVSAKERSRN